MSREACLKCGKVVSTTAVPNKREGYFINDADAEMLVNKITDGKVKEMSLRDLWRISIPIVLCDECQQELKPPNAN